MHMQNDPFLSVQADTTSPVTIEIAVPAKLRPSSGQAQAKFSDFSSRNSRKFYL
jgi:hypothetical protein